MRVNGANLGGSRTPTEVPLGEEKEGGIRDKRRNDNEGATKKERSASSKKWESRLFIELRMRSRN